MSSPRIPREHAFAYSARAGPATATYIDDFPPWAPALFPRPQLLPTDAVSIDAASSLWIEEQQSYTEEHSELDPHIPWLDDGVFDAGLLATLALDEQLLYWPEQAFADICWAAAVYEPPVVVQKPAPATVPDPHPPLADVTNRRSPPPLPIPEQDEETDTETETITSTPAPPYSRAVDEHNRLLALNYDFAPLRRRDVEAKEDYMRIDPFPRYLQPNTATSTLDAAAALLMLQPTPQTHWQVSGSVGVGDAIVMLGLDDAGKTSLVNRLHRRAELPSGVLPRTTPTVGSSMETIVHSAAGHSITVWEFGGQDKVRPLWRRYMWNGHAFAFVVDASAPERFALAAEELAHVCGERAEYSAFPFLVLVNKVDLPGAASVEEVRRAMGVDALFEGHTEWPWGVMGVSAMTGEGLDEVLDWVVRRQRVAQEYRGA
uniref:ADP-ribosylation factor n=1 Tax=Mycena chlorophos TaxID=658473 RepID=A0ABQ0M0P2_MYCCL|nr:ADP-ribosylation factor [Mycena chlorophos]